MGLISLIKSAARFALKIKTTISCLLQLRKDKPWMQESYYPEFADRRKSIQQIKKEQRNYIMRYSRPNDFYFLYGFDIKDFRNPEEYVDYLTVFRSVRDRLNKSANSPFVVLRDKFLFGIVAEGLGINTPHNIALIDGGNLIGINGEMAAGAEEMKINEFQTLFPDLDAFAKIIDGECANGVFHIEVKDGIAYVDGEKCGMDKLEQIFSDRRYVLQHRISQHESLNAIFPKSINTIRLVSVYNKKSNDVEVLSAVLRVGRGNNHVDNWAKGGLSIGIDTNNGKLREYGFYKPGFGTKTNAHPDTRVVFNGYKIPYFEEAVEMAKRFHYYLKGIHSIGWDIAITPTGPCFIEGNDNWEISLMQVCNHGLQGKFEELFCMN